ncbi:MAG TPA: vitamin B12 dependent-methionine synthase activation domain-containing protein, partial [Bacteroidales bacterium]|nr:vitamin B12 dependent-methionine synthase activation domain-containing protein [Bacteroidales bacterium]
MGENSAAYIASVKQEYATLRNLYANRKVNDFVSLAQARTNKLQLNWETVSITKPSNLGVQVFENYSIAEIIPYIDWTYFFHAWEMKGKYPAILTDAEKGEEATKLFADAQQMIQQITKDSMLQAHAVIGLYPANSVDDDIEIYADEQRTQVLATFHNLRQQTLRPNGQPNMCFSDFIAPKSSGKSDYIGAFACTAGVGADEWAAKFKADGDEYSEIMIKILADRLAEAFAELLHHKVRTTLWGYAADEQLTVDEMIQEKYQGIRPAYGYPACPDHSEKQTLFALLNVEKNIHVRLTESFMMHPGASVSGLFFAHPESTYFGVGKVNDEQLQDYA